MNKNTTKAMMILAMGLSLSAFSQAQIDTPHAPKKAAAASAKDTKTKADAKKAARAKAEAEARAKAVDINSATKEELKKLPGITDAYADGIIAHRPYHTKADLVVKNIIPLGLYQSLRKQIAAK